MRGVERVWAGLSPAGKTWAQEKRQKSKVTVLVQPKSSLKNERHEIA